MKYVIHVDGYILVFNDESKPNRFDTAEEAWTALLRDTDSLHDMTDEEAKKLFSDFGYRVDTEDESKRYLAKRKK